MTKYYFFTGQSVVMKRGIETTLACLHSDYHNSTLMATQGISVTGQERYYAYGKDRHPTGTVPTENWFTGEKEDATGLVYMNARYYDPALGQFVSPDTIVPDATNVFDYNRYIYVRGNPLKYTDPTGHQAACAAGDAWCWQDRWYCAHGHFWDAATSHWSSSGKAQFDDPQILSDAVGEAGIRCVGGLFGLSQWAQGKMELMGQGIVALAQKVGDVRWRRGGNHLFAPR